MAGKLYLCATPIGNLEDMTFRAIRILQEVDLIAAEDTRNSIKLLNHFELHTPMTSYHEYNKYDKGRELVHGVRGRPRSDKPAGRMRVCDGTDTVGTFDEKICLRSISSAG